jgi:hypothetical protein
MTKSKINSLLHTLHSKDLLANPWVVSLALFGVLLISYILVIPRLGFYWDSWPMNWIAQTRGPQGLAQYFSTNRPVWGLLYQVTLPALGSTPLPYQIMALIWHWWMAVALWWLLRLLWPRQPEPALWTSLLFIVYPGFQQHSIGLLYSHFYIVLTAFLVSLACPLLALKYPRWRWPLLAIGLLLSAVNLLMMEYFFLLELLRPVLLWLAVGEVLQDGKALHREDAKDAKKDKSKRENAVFRNKIGFSSFFSSSLRSSRLCGEKYGPSGNALRGAMEKAGCVVLLWAPYLAVFLAAGIWRAFFFPYQTNNYQMITLGQLIAQPLQTLGLLAWRALEQIGISVWLAWVQAGARTLDKVSATRYTLLMAITIAVVFLSALLAKSENQPGRKDTYAWGGQALLIAGIALGLAGWPFWLTSVPFSLKFAYDRFTLPYMLGACLFVAGLIALLPWRPARWLVLASLVGVGVGFQYQAGLAFRQDWVYQQQFFWQLTWRIPNLKPGTLIIANENLGTAYSTDNSLSAPINWIYDPENASQNIRYLMVYPTIRQKLNLAPGTPVNTDLLVGEFNGNTSQSISLFYNSVSCLRVLDPVLDDLNPAPEDALRKTMQYSDFGLITPLKEGQAPRVPLPQIFGPPPERSWCKTFETADLLRQAGQWQKIIQLWESDQDLFSDSRNPAEAAPFIEAYARSGQWEQAAPLTKSTLNSRPILCSLWQNLDQTTPAAPQKSAAVQNSLDLLKCWEYGIYPIQP